MLGVHDCLCPSIHLAEFFTLTYLLDMKLGRNLARTFLDYYKLTGYISTKPSSGLNPKGSQSSAKEGKGSNHPHQRAASEPLNRANGEERSVSVWSSLWTKPLTCFICLSQVWPHVEGKSSYVWARPVFLGQSCQPLEGIISTDMSLLAIMISLNICVASMHFTHQRTFHLPIF